MTIQIHFTGPIQYRLQRAAELSRSLVEVSTRRTFKGPRRPGWNWFVELGTHVLRRQLITAFNMTDVKRARTYLDSVVISSQACSEVVLANVVQEKFRGTWVAGKRAQSGVTVLYLHGGGYSFYPRAYAHFVALITLAAEAKTFALDYRLAPEHRFPAQLEDALSAYRWLLETGTDPEDLVIIGDSAGGNLALALLLAARDSHLALPALAIVLSPATDFVSDYPSISSNQEFDWINERMLRSWAEWFCDPAQRKDPFVSPLRADLRDLPPIHMQAGRCEILHDSIQAFADRGRSQGADVILESWEDMTHVFQMFGADAPQSSAALRRIGEVINMRVRGREKKKTVFC
jgi:epsilon-lactone hydrolase